ncbi:MAG: SGNH/GDSL hydrolase family protein [Saprospiraceae bacterium]|nr:SGNH/GDSL hydrolase family protein [Saprospiraceae bacterium]
MIKWTFNRILFFIVSVVLLIACAEESKDNVDENQSVAPPSKLTYLALGDSYTIGESVAENERYPNQLTEKLKSVALEFEPVKIIAKTGWTTGELQTAIDAENVRDTFDLVSLLIGVNNQYRGYSLVEYEQEFDSLLRQSIRFAGGKSKRVFVVSIPDYAYTPFGQRAKPTLISQKIDSFNLANQTITKSYGISYFNITPISRKGLEQKELVATDELHPSGEQYKLWVASFVGEVAAKLQ